MSLYEHGKSAHMGTAQVIIRNGSVIVKLRLGSHLLFRLSKEITPRVALPAFIPLNVLLNGCGSRRRCQQLDTAACSIHGISRRKWRYNVGVSPCKAWLIINSYPISALAVYLYPSYATFKVLARRSGTDSQDVEKWCGFRFTTKLMAPL